MGELWGENQREARIQFGHEMADLRVGLARMKIETPYILALTPEGFTRVKGFATGDDLQPDGSILISGIYVEEKDLFL